MKISRKRSHEATIKRKRFIRDAVIDICGLIVIIGLIGGLSYYDLHHPMVESSKVQMTLVS